MWKIQFFLNEKDEQIQVCKLWVFGNSTLKSPLSAPSILIFLSFRRAWVAKRRYTQTSSLSLFNFVLLLERHILCIKCYSLPSEFDSIAACSLSTQS